MRNCLLLVCLMVAGLVWAEAPVQKRLESVVFVAAHPDDMAGELGLALLMRGKFEVHVVDFTHGERGLGEEKFRSGETKAMRIKEEEAVCAGLGAKLHWMDEIDGEAYASDKTCARMAQLFRELKPRAVIAHWPIDHHLDHVMSFAATMKAIQLAGIKTEIYFHEQDHQSHGFQPVHWVDVSSVQEEKDRLISLYVCQGGPTTIKANKRLNGDFRGRNMRPRAFFAEAYADYPGLRETKGCIFNEL